MTEDFSENNNPAFYSYLVQQAWRKEPNIDIALVVINAGCMFNGSFDRVPEDKLQAMIDVDLYQYGMLAKLVERKLRERSIATQSKSGLIIVSSAASWNTLMGNSLYSGTKAFVTYLGECMAYEQSLLPEKEQVIEYQILCPFGVSTNLIPADKLQQLAFITTV